MEGKKKRSGRGKVVVAMSGGVDSSVAAALLVEEGYEAIGMHLHIWSDPVEVSEEERHKFPQKQCCTVESLERARKTCQRLGIPFYTLNVSGAFKRRVVDYFIETYSKGLTPNPCIECNRQIRFGLLLKYARSIGASYLATGHYARRRVAGENGNLWYELLRARDPFKDQSYFLYTLNQRVLASVLFPIGEHTKREIRAIARSLGLKEVSEAEESQNICFFPDKRTRDFLKRHVKKKDALKAGPILTLDGKRVATHEGIALYTIGQRHGLKLGGLKEPVYVIGIDARKNMLLVGPHSALECRGALLSKVTFVGGKPPQMPHQILVKIRHPGALSKATLVFAEKGKAKVIFERPLFALSPGQSMVFYDSDVVLGGGIVEESLVPAPRR